MLAVQHMPGWGVTRQVTVDLGTRQKSVVVSDWMIRTVPGELVWFRHERRFVRTWIRHRIVLPGYRALVRLPGLPLAEHRRAPYD